MTSWIQQQVVNKSMRYISISQKPSTKCLTAICYLNLVISEFVELFSPGFKVTCQTGIEGVYSEWLPVTSGVLQGLILGAFLFSCIPTTSIHTSKSRNPHCSQMTLNCTYLLYNQTQLTFFKMISTTQ